MFTQAKFKGRKNLGISLTLDMAHTTYTLEDDIALTPSLDFETDALEEVVTDKELTFLALLVEGEALGDGLSLLFSRTLTACTGLGEFPAEMDPVLHELLEFVEIEEGLLERPLWSLDGGEERLFITSPPFCLAAVKEQEYTNNLVQVHNYVCDNYCWSLCMKLRLLM